MTTTASLDGCELKLARALTHFSALQDKIAEVVNDKTKSLRTGVDPKTGSEFAKIEGPTDLGPELGIIVGDYVHNLRTSLDHLVHQLAVLNGAPPLDVDRSRQFPICTDEPSYWREVRRGVTYRDRCLSGIEEEHRKRVDAIQPYHYGKAADRNSIAIVGELDNADKHRVVNAAVTGLRWPDGTELRTSAGMVDLTISFGPGEGSEKEAADLPSLPEPGLEEEVDVNRRPAPLVLFAYGPRSVSINQLDKAGRDVAEVIRWFKPLFPEAPGTVAT